MAWPFRCSAWIVVVAIAVWTCKQACRAPVPDIANGFVHADFAIVRDKFDELLRDGWILGSQYAVYYKDELVVDLAGGYADEEAMRTLKTDNYVVTFSTIKPVLTLLLSIVVEQAGASFEERVSKYWPEFGQNGKENVTIANVMLHQGGVCGLDSKFKLNDAEENNEYYQKVLAEQRPLTPLNERPYYHAWTYGLYIDQLIRRVDKKGRSARQVLAEEIERKCGGELDVRLGVSNEEFYRLARHYPASLRTVLDYDSFFGVVGWILGLLNVHWEPTVQSDNGPGNRISTDQYSNFMEDMDNLVRINDPNVASKFAVAVAGSMATAHDLARVYNILANGGHCLVKSKDGGNIEKVKVLSEVTLKKLLEERYSGQSGFFPIQEPRSLLGWVLTSPANTSLNGSPGYGGQQGFTDLQLGLSYIYFTNFLKPVLLIDHALVQLRQVTYKAVAAIRERETSSHGR